MRAPHDYPRRVLLAVVGLTPQVVTETLYALIMQQSPPFLPTAVHLISTADGAERIHRRLLDPGNGALCRFAKDYAPELVGVLARPRLHVLTDAQGRPLADIASAEESMAAADQILSVVRDLTADPSAAVCASIAGGRKTMGFLLGYAMSLFGRPQDRLTHVLVGSPFQDHPEFFYPPPRPRSLALGDGSGTAATDDARLVLTDIPFVRLRSGLPRALLQGRASFMQTVTEAQESLAPARLILDVAARAMRCQQRIVRLPPVEFAFVLWLARRRLRGAPHGGALCWHEASAEEFLSVYRSLPESSRHVERVACALREGIAKDWFEQRVSRVNKLVNEALGLLAPHYRIVATGRRPNTRYGLPPGLGAVEIREEDEGDE